MEINFTITYEAHFDLDQAEKDFRETLYWNPEEDINKVLYDITEQNIDWPPKSMTFPTK